MTTIVLKPGDRIVVNLKDTDGEFVIEYGRSVLSVSADLPDTSGRVGVIYSEEFGDKPTRKKPVGDVEFIVGRNEPSHGFGVSSPKRRTLHESDLVDTSGWVSKDVRNVFLANLAVVEKGLTQQPTKGITRCSICAKSIGAGTLYSRTTGPKDAEVKTSWPIELASHFVKKHDCVPPSWFVLWVNDTAAELNAKRKKSAQKKAAKKSLTISTKSKKKAS